MESETKTDNTVHTMVERSYEILEALQRHVIIGLLILPLWYFSFYPKLVEVDLQKPSWGFIVLVAALAIMLGNIPNRSNSRNVDFCRSAPIPPCMIGRQVSRNLLMPASHRFLLCHMKMNKGTNPSVSAYRNFTKQYDTKTDSQRDEIELKRKLG